MSEVRVNKLSPRSGTTVTLGDSGDTITIPSGVTLSNAGTFTNFQSTGIDDNATSTAITIDSSQNVGIGTASPATKLDVSTGTDADGINISLFSNTQNTFSVLRLGHSLNDTIGTQTALTVSDGLGKIAFSGSDGTSFYDGATIEARASQNFSGTQGGTYLQFYTTESLTKTLSERMRIDSYGNVGIGTSSPIAQAKLTISSDNTESFIFLERAGTARNDVAIGNNGGKVSFRTGGDGWSNTSERMVIDSSGYVGIGTTTPSPYNLYVKDNSGTSTIRAESSDNYRIDMQANSGNGTIRTLGSYPLILNTNQTERMRITSTGNVGIGTSSPISTSGFANLSLNGTTGGQLAFHTGGVAKQFIYSSSTDLNIYNGVAGNLIFHINNTERMRIDSSGRLFVNATSPILDGSEKFGVNGGHSSFQYSATPLLVNKTGTDGAIISVRKDGTVIGNIGVSASDNFALGSTSANHAGITFGTNTVAPMNVSNFTNADDVYDLGNTSARWQDIYATNGTIQTSDQNEKQSIQSLTTAEMNVAKRLSSLIKTFKWNSSVEEKGDSARTHTGIIAQDVQQAFTDEGLDASNYALFISSTWWENSEGDIQEEATDGYTERTRLGVRYPELLSFIQAYNDQRFTELEARITALETNQP